MEKVGRNEPCPCGSGKKYKNCHMDAEAAKGGKNKAVLIGMLLVIFLVVGIIGFYLNAQNQEAESSGQFQPGPPPDGPAPPGKVWSYEHGHWHDL